MYVPSPFIATVRPCLQNSFFHFHSESASGCDASSDSIAEADPGTSALNDFIPLNKIKPNLLEMDLLKDTRSAFFTPDSPQDEHIIVSDEKMKWRKLQKDEDTMLYSHDIPKSQKEKLEQQKAKAKEEVASLKVRPPFSTVVEHTSGATTKDVCSAGQATASPAEGEKNTNPTSKFLLYDKYNDKDAGKEEKASDHKLYVLYKGHYLNGCYIVEDGTLKSFQILKSVTLYLADEWREGSTTCRDRK
ncbi:hypothetical protein Tco_0750487 [Tanacetum coccineum]|uniref:Uncharacterized protein n=1 Tax=Tanacetum coccineum TaxID=301880 RepID=A0ABQ4Z2G9_9ASTR